MDDISIKILDTLFDLCEGENYAILEKDELISRASYHNFAADELTEILEALSADGLIDLKYADNREFCVAMKTKGRSLIKQSRERLQRLIEENPEIAQLKEEERIAEENRQEREALEEERERILREHEDKLAEAKINLDEAISPADKAASKEELRRVKRDIRRDRERVADLDEQIREADERERTTPTHNLARGYSVHASGEKENRNSGRDRRRDKKLILAAFVGSAVGAAIINIIFLIIFLVKFGK